MTEETPAENFPGTPEDAVAAAAPEAAPAVTPPEASQEPRGLPAPRAAHTAGPTQYERNWAMMAHLTALLTVAVGMATGGLGAVVALLVPLGLYLYFGPRSRYVAYHALQSTVFQALAAVLYVLLAALVGAAIAIAWTAAGLLSIILVGLLLMPVALAITLMGGFALVALPVAAVAYSLVGAFKTYEGQPFDYPWVGPAVARTMGPAPVPAAAQPAP